MKHPMVVTALLLASSASVSLPAHAATWNYSWTPAQGETAPKVEVCSFKYGKSWAYSFEQDDGPVSVLTQTLPFLARYGWNDAPPGVAGGVNRPCVGTAAVILGSVGCNDTVLSFEQIAQLQRQGWGVVNHSFWHTGVHWDPKQMNTPAQNRRELFWSQTFFAELIGHGRASTHFVFPNGDYNYGPYLKEYGLLCGTRTSGSSPHNLLDPKLDWLNYPRSYLDEGAWTDADGPMKEFPAAPQAGDFLIDFTHNLDGDSASANNKRWTARLDRIFESYGPKGDNSMWVAPSDEVVAYWFAARAAKVSVGAGRLSVELPDSLPGSALTLRMSGLKTASALRAPAGGALYLGGDALYLTTPTIGETGIRPPMPRVRRIYAGEVKNLTWDKPVSIAGVRINRTDHLPDDFQLKIEALTPQGQTESIGHADRVTLDKAWGNQLYPVLPDRPAVLAKELRITPDPGLSQMEVWAVAP